MENNMKTAREFFLKKYGFHFMVTPDLATKAMEAYAKYVQDQSNPKPFPTFEQFKEWRDNEADGLLSIYEYFRNKMTVTEFPKVGDMVEGVGEINNSCHRGTLSSFIKKINMVELSIRAHPDCVEDSEFMDMADTLEESQETLRQLFYVKAVQDDSGAVADAIKALEGNT